jgi:hypothetical protein
MMHHLTPEKYIQMLFLLVFTIVRGIFFWILLFAFLEGEYRSCSYLSIQVRYYWLGYCTERVPSRDHAWGWRHQLLSYHNEQISERSYWSHSMMIWVLYCQEYYLFAWWVMHISSREMCQSDWSRGLSSTHRHSDHPGEYLVIYPRSERVYLYGQMTGEWAQRMLLLTFHLRHCRDMPQHVSHEIWVSRESSQSRSYPDLMWWWHQLRVRQIAVLSHGRCPWNRLLRRRFYEWMVDSYYIWR